MKSYLIRFGIIAVLFLGLDAVWLSQTQEILYRRYLPGILLDGFRLFPALLFYILYVCGIMVFAVEPGRYFRAHFDSRQTRRLFRPCRLWDL